MCTPESLWTPVCENQNHGNEKAANETVLFLKENGAICVFAVILVTYEKATSKTAAASTTTTTAIN